LVLLFLLFGKDANSQPFHYLDVGISRSSFNQLSDIYSNNWDLSSVNSIQFRTPFYIGTAGVGLDFFSYTNKSDNTFEISSLNASAFFGLDAIKTKNFIISTGVLIGVQRIEASAEFFGENPAETELYTALALEPQVKLGNFILFTEFQYRRIFNYYRQNLFTVGLGLKYRIGIGEKLRGFID